MQMAPHNADRENAIAKLSSMQNTATLKTNFKRSNMVICLLRKSVHSCNVGPAVE